jgi:hypothetical protein
MEPSKTLALSLTYVAQELGVMADRESLAQLEPAWDILPSIEVVEKGVYGTYPCAGPSIVKFDNGLYYYVKDVTDRKIINTDYTVVDMALFGTPTDWARYALPTPTHQRVIHMDETVDNIHYKSYGTPRKMYVRKPGGITKIDFSGTISTFRDFVGVPNTAKKYNEPIRVMGLATYPIVPNGQTFYMDIDDWGEFTRTGKVKELRGYFENDLSPAEMPPKSRQVVPAVAWPKGAVVQGVKSPYVVTTEIIKAKPMTRVIPKVNTDYFRFQYLRADQKPIRYQAMQPVVVIDYSCQGKRMSVIRGDTFGVFGTFRPYGDDRVRLLIKLEGTKLFDQWYGIPELSVDGKRIVEAIPDYTEITAEAEAVKQQIERDTKPSHHVFDFLSSIELFIKHDLLRIRR